MIRTILSVIFAVGICRAAVDKIDQDILKGYLENGAAFDFVLIDVRTSEEISAAIGSALCKPYNLAWPNQFKDECARIPKDQRIIVYCQSGGRSSRAAAYLNTNGYTSVYDAGGFLTWKGATVPPSEIKPASLLPEPSMRAATGDLRHSMPVAVDNRFAFAKGQFWQ